jgi:hypothetical protein
VTAVGILTHDREASLASCVASYLANCRRYARTPEFIVADDSAAPESGVRARAALRSLQTAGGEAIRYAGLAEKKRFADALARESTVPRHIVDFALFGDKRCRRSTGANRNSLLLDTLGSLVFSVDDDTLCRTAAAPELSESVSFLRVYDPTDFWFFPDRRSALEAVHLAESDVLGAHERLLGRTLTEIDSTVELSGQVVIALHGLVGDSGMGSPRYLLTLRGPSRERLLASQTAYLSALRSREVLRTVSQPTIAASAFCMTAFFGFDNRRLLPPFFPVERNSDGIFGVMIHRYLKGSHVAFLPWILYHAPAEGRAFEGNAAWRDAESVRIADLVVASILAHRTGDMNISDEACLQRAGKYFRELGSLKLEEFEVFAGTVQRLQNLAATTLLEARLHEYDASPAFWADDVKRTIDTLRNSAAGEDYLVPRDLRARLDPDGARRLGQDLFGKFGELLEAWPVLVEAARRLQARDCRVSERV